MKYFILALLFTSVVIADDFSPHVKISAFEGNKSTEFSGTIFDNKGNYYYVLSCCHGIDEFKSPKVFIKVSNPEAGIEVPVEIIKSNIDVDLAIFRFKKLNFLNVKPIKISEKDAPDGSVVISFGYPGKEIAKREMKKIKSNYFDTRKRQLTHCIGKIDSGMSGGALIYSNSIIGVLSTSTKTPVGGLYAPQDDILLFVK